MGFAAPALSPDGDITWIAAGGAKALADIRTAANSSPDGRPFDLAVVCDALCSRSLDADNRALLAYLRDIAAHETWVLVPATPPAGVDEEAGWSEALPGLGFVETTPLPLSGAATAPRRFSVALHSYKKTPDWLGPDGWAHPELFDRYRW